MSALISTCSCILYDSFEKNNFLFHSITSTFHVLHILKSNGPLHLRIRAPSVLESHFQLENFNNVWRLIYPKNKFGKRSKR